MAHFLAEVQGSRGTVHRLGGKDSGANAKAQGWNFGVSVRMAHEDGEDVAYVYLTSGSNGHKPAKLVGRFTVADLDKEV